MDREGILTICTLTNTGTSGFMPVEKLVVYTTAYYEKRTVGVTRLYAALGADHRIDMLVRVKNTVLDDVAAALYVVMPNGNQYRVDAMQEVVGAEAWDLTLVRLEDLYDVVDAE